MASLKFLNTGAIQTYTIPAGLGGIRVKVWGAAGGPHAGLNSYAVTTTVNNANLGNISKSVDNIFATCGDTLTYTIVIPNIGNVTATSVIFKDTIPNGTSLVANTVTINGVTQPVGTNPQTGINIGQVAPSTITTVTFQVTVNC